MTIPKYAYATLLTWFLALGGCFDINQTFELTDEGQATFRFLLAFDAEFLALAESEDMDMASVCQTEDFLAELPEGLAREQTYERFDDTLICGYSVFGPIEKFEDLSAELVRETGNADVLTLSVLDDNQVEISSVYRFDEQDLESSEEGGLGQAIKQMIASNFAGHVITWSFRAPRIVETNGELSPDGQTVTWVIPFAEAIVSGGEYRFHVIADYSKPTTLF